MRVSVEAMWSGRPALPQVPLLTQDGGGRRGQPGHRCTGVFPTAARCGNGPRRVCSRRVAGPQTDPELGSSPAHLSFRKVVLPILFVNAPESGETVGEDCPAAERQVGLWRGGGDAESAGGLCTVGGSACSPGRGSPALRAGEGPSLRQHLRPHPLPQRLYIFPPGPPTAPDGKTRAEGPPRGESIWPHGCSLRGVLR